jgi:hypothetical protein
MGSARRERAERGTILLVVVFIATAIAGLALLGSSRVVSETRHHRVLENESQAYNDAFAQIHLAMNVVNTSAYDDENKNVAIREAIAGQFGGTVATAVEVTKTTESAYSAKEEGVDGWMDDPEGVFHGFIQGTNVRVYQARDYIKRIQKLRDTDLTDVDPLGDSDRYFILEAAGRAGDTVRLVSALVRETQPFSSYVFFQNQHTLGVSGSPLGLIHTNESLDFYFANGNYQDAVSAVKGFGYKSGATAENTFLADANPDAAAISLDKIDFPDLQSKAKLYNGAAGLDAEVSFLNKGQARVKPYTKPRWDTVTTTTTTKVLDGYTTQTTQQTQQVQVGTQQVQRTRQVIDRYDTVVTWVTQPVYTTQTETYTVQVPVYENQQVTTTTQVPVYSTRMVTKTRTVKVFVPYDNSGSAGGGTTVGGGGILGEYKDVIEEYQVEESYISGYTPKTTTTTQQVQVGTKTETRTRQVQVQTGTKQVQQTTQTPVYRTETYDETVPVYESKLVDVTTQVPVYKDVVTTSTTQQYAAPVGLASKTFSVVDGGVIFVDGRVLALSGDLVGRVTLVGSEKVRITGNIRYIDAKGRTAMLNGSDAALPYSRNTTYSGDSVLGIIAKDDILFTSSMPTTAEVNATLMSVEGRVGSDAILLDTAGNPVQDTAANRKKYLTPEQIVIEGLYDKTSWKTKTFVKDSLRRIGGIISNDRIVETFIKAAKDGTATVAAGFKKGAMRFDFNLLHNPPPNFVEVPRPVLAYFAPVFLVRNSDE